MPVAWILNFDADRELAGRGSSRAAERRARELVPLTRLLRDGDVVVDGELPAEARRYRGRAWCPTPSALTRLARAGVAVPPAPSLEVLRRVNTRRFCAELGQTLPGALFTDDDEALRVAVARPINGAWCMKRAFSTSGSGRRVVAPGALAANDAAWARRSLQAGGLQIEPWVRRTDDFAIHGHVPRRGEVRVGVPCAQRCDGNGRWLESSLAPARALRAVELDSLFAEAARAAVALKDAGYFGPFNVDAFRYRGGDGLAFNPRCEINARYTMGWVIGMAGRRPDLEDDG